MILGWLARLVLAIALGGLAVIELGSPLVTRLQLDGLAEEAASEAATALGGGSWDVARDVAARIASARGATLSDFGVDQSGRVWVTVRKEAQSLVLKKWSRTADWYSVRVSAAGPAGGAGR